MTQVHRTPPHLDIRHLLDPPAGRAGGAGPLLLTGWCFDHGGQELAGLRARVGGRTFVARRKQARAGVLEQHPRCAAPDQAGHAGFSVQVELTRADATLDLEVKCGDGRWYLVERYDCATWLPVAGAWSGFKKGLRRLMKPRRRFRIGLLSCGRDELCHLTSLYEAFRAGAAFDPCVVVYGIRHPATGFASDASSYAAHLRSRGLTVCAALPEDLDLVLTFLPYEGLLDDGLKRWFHRQRVAYVPYGALVNYVGYANPFYDRCWRIFVDAPHVWDRFAEERNVQWAAEHCVVAGLPKLDGFRSVETAPPDYWPRPRSAAVKRVLILDHWTQEWSDPDEGSVPRNGYSQFLKYRELLLELPGRYPQADFVFRPHPLLFDNLKKTGLQTDEEITRFIREFTAHGNARYDQVSLDYILVFKESDCLIAPGISCLVEYLPSRKPVLLLDKGDGHGLNAYGDALVSSHYRASRPEEVRQFLEETVLGGRDPLAEHRLAAMKQHLITPEAGAGVVLAGLLRQALERAPVRPSAPLPP